MFKSIKLKIIQGRKLNPFATAKVLQEHEDRLNALEGNESSEEEPETPSNPLRSIKINVNDGVKSVSGASVIIDETTKTTGSAGGCTFNDVSDGEVNVEVSKEGYTTLNETINVSEDNTNFTIILTEN